MFYILWDRIKAGEPVGAYVKNRIKDGRHYWVFAVVTPFEGGFLSVRLKPSSPLFRTIQKEYEALRQIEINERQLLAELKALQTSVTTGLTAIDRCNQRILNGTDGLISQARWLERSAAWTATHQLRA